jgi:hypothetical protein
MTGVAIPNKCNNEVMKAIKRVIDFYKGFGHTTRVFRTDREAVFQSIEQSLNQVEVSWYKTNPGRHEKMAERAIRVLKDKARTILLSLPFRLPGQLYRHLIEYTISCCNIHPNSKTNNNSPRNIVTGTKLSLLHHFRGSFGDIGIFKDPNSTNDLSTPKAHFGMIIGRDGQCPGSLKVFLLETQEVVMRGKYTRMPITRDVIAVVN